MAGDARGPSALRVFSGLHRRRRRRPRRRAELRRQPRAHGRALGEVAAGRRRGDPLRAPAVAAAAAAVVADSAPRGSASLASASSSPWHRPARRPHSLVELKAVEAGYPLYGRLRHRPRLARCLPWSAQSRALVHASLLTRLGLTVGDRLRIGALDFTISGVIVEEPDRVASVFALGPRVLIAADDLDRTGLVRPGSRVRYRTLLMLRAGADAEAFRDELARAAPGHRPASRHLHAGPAGAPPLLGAAHHVPRPGGARGPDGRRHRRRLSVSAFVRKKRSTIAVLKCLGASWREVLAIYLVQTALARARRKPARGPSSAARSSPCWPRCSARLLPFPVASHPVAARRPERARDGTRRDAPVLAVAARRHPPTAARPHLEKRASSQRCPRRRPWPAALVIAAGLSALALWQAGSWKIGGLFIGGLALALVVLALSARLIVAASRRARRGSAGVASGHGQSASARQPGGHGRGLARTGGDADRRRRAPRATSCDRS